MPAAQITLPAGLSREALHRCLANVSAAMGTVLSSSSERVSVWINQVEPDLWTAPGPFVHVLMLDGRPRDVSHHLIRQVTDGLAHALGIDPGVIRVVVTPVDADLWGIGGMPASVYRAEEIAARARVGG